MLMFVFALVVLIATIAGSISGIGGGVLIKPVMDAAFPLTTSQISFLSGTTVLTMTIVSLLRSRKDLKLDLRTLMLAIGGAIGGIAGKQVFDIVKKAGAVHIKFMCLLTCPEGIKALHDAHPDVEIVTGAIDSGLNEDLYIVPGIGDGSDRLFGTK